MKPYIIAETAYNHEGDLDYLKKMIKEIAEIGLNAVKFHLLIEPASYLQKNHPLLKEIEKWTFSAEEWGEILAFSQQYILDIIALCDDIESLQYINSNHSDIKGIEIHASALNDFYLLQEAVKFPGTIILGVGGSTVDEIEYAIRLLKKADHNDILLMYGFQSYPTYYEQINLAKMLKIRELFEFPVGYADHTGFDDRHNVDVSVMGAAMGINVLEKHYTPDYGVERIDYHAAVGKKLMTEIKNKMELYLSVHGDGSLDMSEPELKYGNTGPMKKAIVARENITKGEMLTLDNLCFKRTEEETYIKQNQLMKLVGLKTTQNIDQDEIIDFSKVKYEFNKNSFAELTGGLEEKR